MRPIDYFDTAAAAFPDRDAVIDHRTKRALTYRGLSELTHRLASALWARGLGGEFRAAICCPNDPRYLVCLLGVLRAGGVVVPISANVAPESIAEYLAFVDADCLFYHSSAGRGLATAAVSVPDVALRICIDGPRGVDSSLEELLGQAPADLACWHDVLASPNRLTAIYQTGGTTRAPRAVALTEQQWTTRVETSRHYLERPLEPTAVPVTLAATPLAHRAGWVAVSMLALGATIVVMPNLDPREVLHAIAFYRVTHLWMPPSGLSLLLAHPRVRELDYSSLRCLVLGSAPVASDTFREAVEVFGPIVCQEYGQTEAGVITWLDSSTVAHAAAGIGAHRLQSCGKAVYSMQLAVLDDDTRVVPVGARGEIAVRGRGVADGYLTGPAAGIEHLGDWHRTGDIGYVDADGYLTIVDRKKDVVVSCGFSVHSIDVERVVLELPEIAECAVIAVPDETRGEAVKAIVTVRPGDSIAAWSVIRHCRRKLGVDYSPLSVDVVERLPKTTAGKTDKRALRAFYWQCQSRNIH